MIKTYLRLLTFFAIQHQVLAGDRSFEDPPGLNAISRRRSTSSSLRSDILRAPEHAKDKSKVAANFDKHEKEIKPSKPISITPVLEYENRHRHHHHHHKHKSGKKNITDTDNKNTTVKTNDDKKQSKGETATANLELNKGKTEAVEIPGATLNTPFKVADKDKVTPAVPFYRRNNYLDEQERNKPQKWAHCLDLITPRLKGYKDEYKMVQQNSSHPDVLRLTQLLSVDVSNYTQEEIESILFQLSNIRLRLFRWDYTALTSMLNVVIHGPIHNFKTLKSGIKALFERWHLDTTMITTFLKQTRIFRPPCIDISGLEGSTKKSAGKRFTLPNQNKGSSKDPYGSPSCESDNYGNGNNDQPPT